MSESAAAATEASQLLEQVVRRSYGKLIALIALTNGDVAAAEDALSDTITRALSDWPVKGVPANPEAWLLTVARRKRIDVARRTAGSERVALAIQHSTAPSIEPESDAIPDRRLSLLFACTHPEIDPAARAPLMLQLVLGLNAQIIATAFLTSPSAMGKRLVRAKERIREHGIPFEIPGHEALPERLAAVLDAIYASYTEGWSDAAGSDGFRQELSAEALFLARLVTELLPDEPEGLGLLALLLHAEARRPARRGAKGEYVPLAKQDAARWDVAMLLEAEQLIRRAATSGQLGRFQLEAALQSAHVYRLRTGSSNWNDVVQLYRALFDLAPSPVVAINLALAVGELDGADAGLAEMPSIDADRRLREYQPWWAATASLLSRAGRHPEAGEAYEMAIGLERDPAVRRFLLERQAELPRQNKRAAHE